MSGKEETAPKRSDVHTGATADDSAIKGMNELHCSPMSCVEHWPTPCYDNVDSCPIESGYETGSTLDECHEKPSEKKKVTKEEEVRSELTCTKLGKEADEHSEKYGDCVSKDGAPVSDPSCWLHAMHVDPSYPTLVFEKIPDCYATE